MMHLFRRSESGIFASATLSGHLLRGAIAIALLAWAFAHQSQAVFSFLAAAVALLAFRGCPICWTIGLAETIAQKIRPSAKRN